MWQHHEEHVNINMGKTWICEDCDNKPKFYTKYNYNQHRKGEHSFGFQALCGKLYKWPSQKSVHQGECKKCDEVKKDHANIPENPQKKTFRVRKVKVKVTIIHINDRPRCEYPLF